MMNLFSDETKKVFMNSHAIANRFNHNIVGLDHILFALFEDQDNNGTQQIFSRTGLPQKYFKTIIKKKLNNSLQYHNGSIELKYSNETKKMMFKCIEEMKLLGLKQVAPDILILGILGQTKSFSSKFLVDHNIDLLSTRATVFMRISIQNTKKR